MSAAYSCLDILKGLDGIPRRLPGVLLRLVERSHGRFLPKRIRHYGLGFGDSLPRTTSSVLGSFGGVCRG